MTVAQDSYLATLTVEISTDRLADQLILQLNEGGTAREKAIHTIKAALKVALSDEPTCPGCGTPIFCPCGVGSGT